MCIELLKTFELVLTREIGWVKSKERQTMVESRKTRRVTATVNKYKHSQQYE
jgi:hypothetical protein